MKTITRRCVEKRDLTVYVYFPITTEKISTISASGLYCIMPPQNDPPSSGNPESETTTVETSRRISLRDIAKVIGVSPMTVSLALRDQTRVSPELRERIRKQARLMGYRPDPMLTALAHYSRGKSNAAITSGLAWVNAWPEPQKLRSHREFDQYWLGAVSEAACCGYALEEFVLNQDMPTKRLVQILHARNIRGILLPPRPRDQFPAGENFPWEQFCVVRFGHSFKHPAAHLVASDQMSDGLMAFENMQAHGYRRIGLVTGVLSAKSGVRFAAGYFFGSMKLPKIRQLPVLTLPQRNITEDQKQFIAWIKRHRPDAILTDVAATSEMLKQAGYRVPKDVALAALSILDGNADAGIDQNSTEIGRAAVQLLITLINHNERGIPKVCRELLIEGRWVDGKSLPPKKNSLQDKTN